MGYLIIVAVVILAIPIVALALVARHHIGRHGFFPVIGRALMGRHTGGLRHCNATWGKSSNGITRGTPLYNAEKARYHRAGYVNVLRNVGGILATVAILAGLVIATQVTIITLIGVAAGLAGWYGYRTYRKLRINFNNKTLVRPLARAIAVSVGDSEAAVEKGITLDPAYHTKRAGELARVEFSDSFHSSGAERDTLESLIGRRFPMPVEFAWHTNKMPQHVKILAARPLPNMVKFSGHTGTIESLGKGRYLAGLDKNGTPYVAEFKGEEPHHGFCWGTGVGKSSMLKSMLAQLKHNEPDCTATILDPKDGASLPCLKGVPGFAFYDDAAEFDGRVPNLSEDTYVDALPQMMLGVKSVYDLMISRYAQMKIDPTVEFPSHYFIMEECNSFSLMARSWHIRNKPSKGMGAVPPMWADWIAPIFWRGRQANIFIVLVAQSIQERYLGGLDLRRSLGLVSLAKFKPNQYATYIGTTPIPRMQKGQGRAIFNDGEGDTWVQCVYESDAYLREFAMANCGKNRAADLSPVSVRERIVIQGNSESIQINEKASI